MAPETSDGPVVSLARVPEVVPVPKWPGREAGWYRDEYDRPGCRKRARGVVVFEDRVLAANKTLFREVHGRYNGPDLEKEVLAFWREHDVFAQTIKATRDAAAEK